MLTRTSGLLFVEGRGARPQAAMSKTKSRNGNNFLDSMTQTVSQPEGSEVKEKGLTESSCNVNIQEIF